MGVIAELIYVAFIFLFNACVWCPYSSLIWRVVMTILVVLPRFVIICILIIWVLIIDNAMAMLMITGSGLWGRTGGGQGSSPDSLHQGWLKCRCHKKLDILLLGGREHPCQTGQPQSCWSNISCIIIGRFETLRWTQPSLVASLHSWVLIFVILFHTINDTPPLPQPQFYDDSDKDKQLMDTFLRLCVAVLLVGRYNW